VGVALEAHEKVRFLGKMKIGEIVLCRVLKARTEVPGAIHQTLAIASPWPALSGVILKTANRRFSVGDWG
jgi:hypothetical protein